MRPTGRSGLVEGGVGGEERLVPQVDDAEARRADDADAGRRANLAQPRLARLAFGAGLAEAVGEHGRDRDAEPRAFLRPPPSRPPSEATI